MSEFDFTTQVNGVGRHKENPIPKKNISAPINKVQNTELSFPFLKFLFIIGIISFLGFLGYMIYEGKFQSNYEDNSMVNVAPAEVSVPVYFNATTSTNIVINNNNTIILPKELTDALIKLTNTTT